MERVPERHARAALSTLEAIGAATIDDATFARAGARELAALIGSDLTTLSVCALASGKREVVGFPEHALTPADIACFDRFFHDHPLVRFHSTNAQGGSHRISDSLPDSTFRRTALYAEYYRRIGIEHAVAMPLFVERGMLVSFVLNRSGRDFGTDDCALLESVRGPLSVLYRQVRVAAQSRALVGRLRSWLDAEGWYEVEVDAALRIRRASRRALAMLGVAVPDAGLRPGATLPPALANWLSRSRFAGTAGAALVLHAGARSFALRALPAVAGDGFLLYVGEKELAVRSSNAAALSPREREVVTWVATGKSDAQVAAILGISVRTVQKHLEHIYVKLGVEGRTAAVMRVRADLH
jgi:DNA-binding CsgD family transcriptional regulator